MSKKNPSHYVNNEEFTAQLEEWLDKVYEWVESLEDEDRTDVKLSKRVKALEDQGYERPPVTDDVAVSFLKIAEGLSHKPNFINYAYRDDMVGDAVENCIRYGHNFDVRIARRKGKKPNPFAYFTQICKWAFIRRIEKEKKQLYIKMKCIEGQDRKGTFAQWAKLKGVDSDNPYAGFMKLSTDDLRKFEPKEKSKKKKKKGLEKFTKEEDSDDE